MDNRLSFWSMFGLATIPLWIMGGIICFIDNPWETISALGIVFVSILPVIVMNRRR
jgi:hypothetical protein